MADSLRIVGGKLLLASGGKLALSDTCCCPPPPPCSGPCSEESPCPEGCYCCNGVCQSEPCSSACCLPGGCLFWSGAIWSGDEPEAIPGYTKIPGGWERLYVGGDCLELNEGAQMNQDWFDAALSVDPDAIPISGAWIQIDPSCQDGLTQAACEAQGGTFHAGKTCAEEPCVSCNGACTSGQDCQTGCQCVFTGSRDAIPPDVPDPYTPDFEGQEGACCVGAAVYYATLDESFSFAGWALQSSDCPEGYAPPTSEQVVDCEPALPTCVNCCIPNEFP